LGYFLCGPDALTALPGDAQSRFFEDFFFSVQTMSTIGYGKMAPVSLGANILVFSNVAVVNKHDGVESLVFRIGNERLNQIVEARISVVLIIDEVTQEGESYRTLYDLDLERNQTPIFTFTWTVVHPNTEKSPLRGLTKEDLVKQNAEILVTVAGVDDTFSQTIHSRHSYTMEHILWRHRFVDILRRTEDSFFIDMDNIHTVHPL
jgi:inward rectifier potassium channel